jgi:hypothetical protein
MTFDRGARARVVFEGHRYASTIRGERELQQKASESPRGSPAQSITTPPKGMISP